MLKRLGRPGGWVVAYVLFGVLSTAGWAWAATTGYDPGSERGEIPPEVRQSTHGYRTYSYWHTHHVWYGYGWWHSPYRGYRWGK